MHRGHDNNDNVGIVILDNNNIIECRVIYKVLRTTVRNNSSLECEAAEQIKGENKRKDITH